ncbi:hypothetical protein [Streptomyces sp. NRRL S-350]|uniref:hypothetical protein n=1 Tax=Streptomyces sp. NRRL S-350 TaxID=1463902 RepID=UPI00068C014A|nr:hypothetical protein [Streptomyces sp. NRRL S-350]
MSAIARIRHTRRVVTAAAALGAAAACGSAAAAPAAFAAQPAQPSLTVRAPASVGGAGGPVAFTEDITNPGPENTRYDLELTTTTEAGTPPHAIVIDYKDPADGTWKPVPLVMTDGPGNVVYAGTVTGLTVPAGQTLTVDLRIGAPMGLPHDGASNGGFRSISLRSALTTPASHGTAQAEATRSIAVTSITSSLAHVPATAVAAGAPIEFDAVLDNPTPSDYTDLGDVLFVDRHASVQVRTADGTWRTLAKLPGTTPQDPNGVYLQGRDSSLRAGGHTVTRVRISYDATTPAGATAVSPCVFVNEGRPFQGTTRCSTAATVQVLPPATTTPKPTPPTSPPAGTASTAPAVPAVPASAASPSAPAPSATAASQDPAAGAAQPAAPASAQLAATGADHTAGLLGAGLALTALGAGALWLRRALRRA